MCASTEYEAAITFNPIDVLVEDALGDTVDMFTDFIDNLLSSQSGTGLKILACAPPLLINCACILSAIVIDLYLGHVTVSFCWC